jgi:hypothetical protein
MQWIVRELVFSMSNDFCFRRFEVLKAKILLIVAFRVKMVVAKSSDTLISNYRSTRCHNPADYNPN